MSRLRMAAYCRVSTEREEQLSSLRNQREFFMQYAAQEGDTLVRIYADEGISGKSMKKRDAFLRLLKDAEEDMFDYVAVKDISRFARNTSDFLHGIRALRGNGVDVRFLSGNHTVIGESEFVLTVFAALAQEESANLSKRVIFGKKQNAKKGRVPNCVYGYDKADTFTLTVNESESAAVRLIFRWYTEGGGSRHIAETLNKMGIPTKRGSRWNSTTVRRVIQNPIYTGILINNKSVTKDFLTGTRENLPENEWYIHERPELQIVSREIFEAANNRLAERREKFKSQSRYSGRHIFSNLIQCGMCGGSFTGRACKNGTVRYRCRTHANGGAFCANSVTITERELLLAVKEYLIPAAIECEDFTKRLETVRRGEAADTGKTSLVLTRENLTKRRVRIKEMYAAGIIDMEELKKEYSTIAAGLAAINSELNKDEEHGDCLNSAELISRHAFTNDDMRTIIERIVVYPDSTAEVYMK